MASNSFKVKNSLVLTPKDLSTLVSPEAGDLACDINDNNKIKRYDANAAAWVEVGSGGVGGVDILFVQDFESASLSSFTQTGLSLSQTDPLKGKVSAVLNHQAAVSQSFKQIIPVDRKFRGQTMVLRLDSKSDASQGNLVINIYDESNSANLVASEQLQLSSEVSGKKTSVGFTIPESCASISYTITALPESGKVSRIDDIICELAETALLETVVELTGDAQTLTIPLTQSGLVQEADENLQINTFSLKCGSVNTSVLLFNDGSLISNSLSTVTATNDPSLGSSYTIQEDGWFSFNFQVEMGTTAGDIYLVKNSITVTSTSILSGFFENGVGSINSMAWSGPLKAGDVVRIIRVGGVATFVADFRNYLSISKAGSLKQVSVNPNSKITIPTSELRMEGASSRGSTATAIVRFDNVAKLRGDAFTVNNDPVLGTSVVMKKAGKLDVSTLLLVPTIDQVFIISKNQANLSALPIASETLAQSYVVSQRSGVSIAWSGFVSIGDIIRVSSNGNPASGGTSNLNLSFQEQEIAVSVTNILPQFSESDSSVRVDTANGYGSTGTKIRRFSNVRDNIGTDIVYADDAVNGATFTVRSAGVYDISYSDQFNVACTMGISKNAGSLTTLIGSLPTQNILAISSPSATNFSMSSSWQGYLVAGDIVRAHSDGQPTGTTNVATFTISKVGKPNVTGVDVTPFTNLAFDKGSIGEIKAFAGNVDATHFLVCDGSAVSRSGYSELFQQIGTSHGQGDGSTTFNLPDYRGRFLRGVAGDSTLDPDKLTRTAMNTGGNTGNTVGSVQSDQIASHTHGIPLGPNVANPGNYGLNTTYNNCFTTYSTTPPTQATGGNETRPENAYVNYGIRFKAANEAIITPTETFSTDTAALRYAGSGTYTLSTLQNAPVGTFITFTYAANTNTRTQTTTRPTQTDADMNANGMQIFARAFNATSTAAQPAAFAIQIGKGLKGKSLDLYKSVAKTTAGEIGFTVSGSSGQSGLYFNSYDEKTGILYIDAGACTTNAITSNTFFFTDTTNQTSGYLVINASKNPALTGLGLNRIAARVVSSSGQSVPTGTNTTVLWDAAKTYDTTGSFNTSTGVYTCPETGFYQVNAQITMNEAAVSTHQILIYKNNTFYSRQFLVCTALNAVYSNQINDVIQLNKGDTIYIVANQNSGVTRNLQASTDNFCSIAKISI